MMSDSPLGETGNATTAQGIAAVSADQGGVSEGSFGGGGRRQSTVVWLKLLAVSVEPFMGFMPPACASPVQGHGSPGGASSTPYRPSRAVRWRERWRRSTAPVH